MTVHGSLSLVPANTASHVIDVIVQKRQRKSQSVCYSSRHRMLSFPAFLYRR